jgi:quinol-cytochrome oxidoreductase complex cytochrome b subunit/cytochrome c551/c552
VAGPRNTLLRDWLEARTGWPSRLQARLEEHIPGGPRLLCALGPAETALLVLQVTSGLALAGRYAAGTATAWAAVARLEQTASGHLLRALHAHGAGVLLAVALLRLLWSAAEGAHRAPRELVHWLGLASFGALTLSAITGSILPWDERAFSAAQVTLGLLGSVPGLGEWLRRLAAGGSEPGNVTLSRAFVAHASLLPMGLLALLALRGSARSRHGFAAPPGLPAARRNQRTPWWPSQAALDAGVALALLVLVTALGLWRGAGLGPPADPSATGAARPAWYFRPVFALLELLPPQLGVLGLLLPLLLFGLLAALPWLDAAPPSPGTAADSWAARRKVSLSLGAGVLALVALALLSVSADRRDADLRKRQASAEARAALALSLSRQGVPSDGALAMLENQPHQRGERLFLRKCVACHQVGDKGKAGREGPHLNGFLSRDWLRGVLVAPDSPAYFGPSGMEGMKSLAALGEQKLILLTELLFALRDAPGGPQDLPPSQESGRKLFESEGCARCHALAPGAATGIGPSLAGYGSAAWLRGLVRDPGAKEYYGIQNKMPAFGQQLTGVELDDVVAYLVSLEEEAAAEKKLPGAGRR